MYNYPEKPEILKGRGFHDYGILRAWGGGGNAFWKFRRQGGVKTWKPSVVEYRYFLELPNRSPEKTDLSPCYGVDVAGSEVHTCFREFETWVKRCHHANKEETLRLTRRFIIRQLGPKQW